MGARFGASSEAMDGLGGLAAEAAAAQERRASREGTDAVSWSSPAPSRAFRSRVNTKWPGSAAHAPPNGPEAARLLKATLWAPRGASSPRRRCRGALVLAQTRSFCCVLTFRPSEGRGKGGLNLVPTKAETAELLVTASAATGPGSTRQAPMPVYGGGGEKCFVCAETVYAAETVSANDWTFHKARPSPSPPLRPSHHQPDTPAAAGLLSMQGVQHEAADGLVRGPIKRHDVL